MPIPAARRPLLLASSWWQRVRGGAGASFASAAARSPSDPLRILFCGSDDFSCVSLRALHEEQQRNPSLIRSIDVVVRPPKPTGRGYRTLRQVPAQGLAEKLGLPIHTRDTFTGWQPPLPGGEPVNLIVAVSFGLFVPRRLLRAARYGGLNLHPSLLPDLRGPAPLHHTLLAGRRRTGVSLQTLSEEAFDAGVVLAQTPAPGLPVAADATVAALASLLAPHGAAMLLSALRHGLHVPPLRADAGWWRPAPGEPLRHAPKVTAADRHADWARCSAPEAAARARALGPLWARALRADGAERRLILEGVEVAEREGWPEEMLRFLPEGLEAGGADVGVVTWLREGAAARACRAEVPYFPDGDAIIIPAGRGGCVRIRYIKVEGERSRPAAAVIRAFEVRHPRRAEGPWKSLLDSLPGADTLALPIEAGLKHLLP